MKYIVCLFFILCIHSPIYTMQQVARVRVKACNAPFYRPLTRRYTSIKLPDSEVNNGVVKKPLEKKELEKIIGKWKSISEKKDCMAGIVTIFRGPSIVGMYGLGALSCACAFPASLIGATGDALDFAGYFISVGLAIHLCSAPFELINRTISISRPDGLQEARKHIHDVRLHEPLRELLLKPMYWNAFFTTESGAALAAGGGVGLFIGAPTAPIALGLGACGVALGVREWRKAFHFEKELKRIKDATE